jgi:DNA-binding PadR family transcriptional regulator
MPTDLRRLLPLRPVDFLILLALVDREQHGYGLAGEIAAATDDLVRLEPGNLYRVIKRLADEGLIAPSARRPAPELDDERRRYYKLTAAGARVATLEAQRLRGVLASPPARALRLLVDPA